MSDLNLNKAWFSPFAMLLFLIPLYNSARAQVVTQYPLKPVEKITVPTSYQDEDSDESDTETLKLTRRISSVSKGFRIQIYSGADRGVAKATKISFMKRFPSVRSYISFEVPYYKIKVGDFKSRKEALEFYRYLNKTYNSMIVPSLINNRIPPKEVDPAIKKTTDSTASSTDQTDSAR